MTKISITMLHANLYCLVLDLEPNSPELSLLKLFSINVPLQPFLPPWFHIYFHLGGCILYSQLGYFSVDIISFCICMHQSRPVVLFYLSFLLFTTKTSIVTGPAKTGHVGTNYTLSHYRSYFSAGTEHLHSVTCIIKPITCSLKAKKFIAIT